MKVLKYIAIIMLATAMGGTAIAQTFVANGINYRIDGNSATVIQGNANDYKGVIILPEKVYYDGRNYTVTSIDERAFEQSGLTEIQIPNTVTSIGERAFANCDNLTSITLPLNLEEVSDYMLTGTSIVNIAVPEGVSRIGIGAFESCQQLHTVLLPSTIEELDSVALGDCRNLYEIYCAAPNPPFVAERMDLKGVDVVLPDDEAVDEYYCDPVWGDTQAFTLYPNEDLSTYLQVEQEEVNDNYRKIGLGNNLAYKIYAGDDLVAFTAADNYYFAVPEINTDYSILPTTMMSDGDEVGVTIETTAIEPEQIAETLFVPVIFAYDGTIYITGDNHGTWTRVYDIYGHMYYSRPSGDSEIFDLPRHRIYIVIVGNYIRKLFL